MVILVLPANIKVFCGGSQRSPLAAAFSRIKLGFDAWAEGITDMLIVFLEFLTAWGVVAVATGFALGSLIRRAERAQKDVVLTCLFAMIENLETSRS